jgi:hypothetical protein
MTVIEADEAFCSHVYHYCAGCGNEWIHNNPADCTVWERNLDCGACES